MKRIRLKSIYTKFILIISIVLMLSSTLALSIVSGYTIQLLYNPLVKMMDNKVSELKRMSDEFDIPPENFVSLADNSFMMVKFYETKEALLDDNEVVSKDVIDAIDAGEISKYYPEKFIHRKMSLYLITRIDEKWVMIHPVINSEVFTEVGNALRQALLLSMIFTILLMLIVLKRLVKPLKKLTRATQKVAEGNFEVEVSYKSEDEMGQLVANFNTMVMELQNMEYLRKDFVSSVSHEFKTPIASIGGFAKILKTDGLNSEQRKEYAQIIISETERLSKLSSNLLRLSSLENQSIIDRTQFFDLDEQIRRVVVLLEPGWGRKHLELELELSKIRFYADEELFQQVWINLIENAIKFSRDSGKLIIRASVISEQVKVFIEDTGMGMTESTVQRIFEKFYQGDSAHKTEGSGLGLSIVKRIIDLYNGKIVIHSEVGVGTRVVVSVPIVKNNEL